MDKGKVLILPIRCSTPAYELTLRLGLQLISLNCFRLSHTLRRMESGLYWRHFTALPTLPREQSSACCREEQRTSCALGAAGGGGGAGKPEERPARGQAQRIPDCGRTFPLSETHEIALLLKSLTSKLLSTLSVAKCYQRTKIL